jgi:hypothetical protein
VSEFPPYILAFEGLDPRVHGWVGEWPPPELLWVVTGQLTGLTFFAEPDRLPLEVLEEMMASNTLTIRTFTRRSYSTVEDDLPNVVRGAQYVEEGWDYDGGHLMRKEEA